MRISANAGRLAAALTFGAAICPDKVRKTHAALEAVRLVASGEMVTSAANVLDHVLHFSVSCVVAEAGEIALSGSRLADLVDGFPDRAEIQIEAGAVAHIRCGRARYKLPLLPVAELPPLLTLNDETGKVELTRGDALRAFESTLFAHGDEETRYYLCGVHLCADDNGLRAEATNGRWLARVTVPATGELARDLILPTPAVRVVLKLLADRSIEAITLRASRTLLEVAGGPFTFVSKLIDGTFPSTSHLIPRPSTNFVVVDRIELMRGVERVQAVAGRNGGHAPSIGLQWSGGDAELRLRLVGCDLADDQIAAMAAGNGRVAVNCSWFLEQLSELGGAKVRVDPDGEQDQPGLVAPVLITDPDDADFVSLLMPCRWPEEDN